MHNLIHFETMKPRAKYLRGANNYVALTLIGFDDCDLGKIYDALEYCSHAKRMQAVEVFINSVEDIYKDPSQVEIGLCLIKIPHSTNKTSRKIAMSLLNKLSGSLAVPPIPVLCESSRRAVVTVGKFSPCYLCLKSEARDFAAIFSAFLFFEPVFKNETSSHCHGSVNCHLDNNEFGIIY